MEFKNVSFEYKNAGAEALFDISFFAKPGQTVGIIGGTGSGKSTLVNLVPNFYSATKGQVLIDGVNADEYDRAAQFPLFPKKQCFSRARFAATF